MDFDVDNLYIFFCFNPGFPDFHVRGFPDSRLSAGMAGSGPGGRGTIRWQLAGSPSGTIQGCVQEASLERDSLFFLCVDLHTPDEISMTPPKHICGVNTKQFVPSRRFSIHSSKPSDFRDANIQIFISI